MSTQILNVQECGYKEFMTIGPLIWGFGAAKGNQRLHIMRVIVVQDATREEDTLWSSLKLGNPIMHWDVDLDIYLEDGTKIEVHSDEEKFIRKMSGYVWELQQKNPRVNFYGARSPQTLTPQEREGLVILTQQLESEKILLRYVIQARDELLASYPWESYEVQRKHKQVLAAEKRIWNLQQRIDKLHAREQF